MFALTCGTEHTGHVEAASAQFVDPEPQRSVRVPSDQTIAIGHAVHSGWLPVSLSVDIAVGIGLK